MAHKTAPRNRRRKPATHARADAPVMADDQGPCPYCGQKYSKNAASKHFIPCNSCDSLEHAGCQH